MQQRPLTTREREILDFLLSVDAPGIEELRQQANFADAGPRVVGDASIDLVIDRDRAPRSVLALSPRLEIAARRRHDLTVPGVGFLSLFTRVGWRAS